MRVFASPACSCRGIGPLCGPVRFPTRKPRRGVSVSTPVRAIGRMTLIAAGSHPDIPGTEEPSSRTNGKPGGSRGRKATGPIRRDGERPAGSPGGRGATDQRVGSFAAALPPVPGRVHARRADGVADGHVRRHSRRDPRHGHLVLRGQPGRQPGTGRRTGHAGGGGHAGRPLRLARLLPHPARLCHRLRGRDHRRRRLAPDPADRAGPDDRRRDVPLPARDRVGRRRRRRQPHQHVQPGLQARHRHRHLGRPRRHPHRPPGRHSA